MATLKAKYSAPVERGTTASGHKVVRQVTASVIKFEVDIPRVVRLEDAMRISSRKVNDDDKKKMGPATIVTATDVVTGEHGVIVCNKVFSGNLTESYPNDGYIGRVFEITKHAKKKGARFEYSPFDIVEVEA